MSAEASTSQQGASAVTNQAATGMSNAQAGGSSLNANGHANTNGSGSQVTAVDQRENRDNPEQTEEELARLFNAKREEDMARRDRTLAEFLVMLDGYKPLVGSNLPPLLVLAYSQIPEEVTEYYLQRSGFDCSDPRLQVC